MFSTAQGCDSIVTLHLTINETEYSEWSATQYPPFEWNNTIYMESGDYVQTLVSQHGCDSIVTLHLTILNTITNEISATACDVYVWNGVSYTTTGDYTQEFVTPIGCDSIVTLHLTVNYTVSSEFEVEACRFYNWNGVVYDVAGDYTQFFTSQQGCDSIVTMHLSFVDQYVTEVDTTVCGSYFWNGKEYNVSGVYKQEMLSVNGCDSVVILTLTVNPYPDEIPAIHGSQSVYVATNLITGVYSYSIDPVANADYYEWDLSGVAWVADTTGRKCILTVTTPGEGKLVIRAWNDCGFTEQFILINAGFFDVGEQEETPSQVVLYPNPTPNKAYVEADDIIRVRLYTMKGQFMQEIPGNHSNRVELYVRNLPPAIYMVEVLTPQGVTNLKLDVHR
jgi:hypothetical protein